MNGSRPDAGKRRILLAINGTDFGGTETALQQLACRLNRRGHGVNVLSIKPPGRMADVLVDRGVEVSSLSMGDAVNAINLLSGSWALSRWMRHHDFDLVHSFLPRANIMSRVANRFGPRRPHVSSERSTDFNRSPMVSRLNRMTSSWTDRVLAVSPAVREVLVKRDRIPGAKIGVLQNGIDVELLDSVPATELRSDLSIDDDGVLFCTAGRLVRDKGHVYLIAALSRIRKRGARAHLVVIGEGPEESTLRRAARERGVEGDVTFLGFRSDVVGILKNTDVFVLPSLEEGIPVVVLEAMTCSVPVIATSVGGVPDLVVTEESGLLVPPEEAWHERPNAGHDDGAATGTRSTAAPGSGTDALARAMERVIRDGELRRRLAAGGRSRVERHFSLDVVVERLETIYSEVIGTVRGGTLAGALS